MKKYSVALLRERLSEALDEAETGIPVVVERRGVRYTLTAETRKRPRTARRPRIEILDPAVADGQWTWEWTPAGLELKGRRRR
jgi:hypothetical protein